MVRITTMNGILSRTGIEERKNSKRGLAYGTSDMGCTCNSRNCFKKREVLGADEID